MNYNYLKYFKILAETEHYTKAAEILNISQPSLSHAISELEKELSIQLFEKQGRNIHMTKYGHTFYNYINSGIQEIEEGIKTLNRMSSIDTGNIDLEYVYTLGGFYVPNIIHSYLALNPNVSFQLRQGKSNDILKDLSSESIDIGFCSYVANQENINFIPILQENIVLLVSEKHPLSKFDEIDLKDIQPDEEWILYSHNSGLRPYLDTVFEQLNMKPDVKCEIEEDTAAIGLVGINYGIALIPDISISPLHHTKKIKIKNKLPERTIYMASLKDRYMTPTIQDFIHYVLHNSFDANKIETND